MNYERMKMKADKCWTDMFPNVEFYMSPKLPKIEFKKGKIKYKITDIRFLNEVAIDTFFQIMQEAMTTPDCEEVSFIVTGIEESRLHLISDIVCAIEYEVKKSGRNGYGTSGYFLAMSSRYTKQKDGTEILTFGLLKDNAKYLYEYGNGKEELNFFDAVMYVGNRYCEEMQSYLENLNEHEQE